jgi:hypothetical protein
LRVIYSQFYTLPGRDIPSLTVVVSNHRLFALLAARAIAIFIATACTTLAFVRSALAVTVACRAQTKRRALTEIRAGNRREAALSRCAIAVAATNAMVTFALAGFTLIVLLAYSANRQVAVGTGLAAIGAGDRRAADLAGGTIAVAAAYTVSAFAMIGTAFRVFVANRTEGKIGFRTKVSAHHWLETRLPSWAIAILVTLATPAQATPRDTLIIDIASGAECEIATPS